MKSENEQTDGRKWCRKVPVFLPPFDFSGPMCFPLRAISSCITMSSSGYATIPLGSQEKGMGGERFHEERILKSPKGI